MPRVPSRPEVILALSPRGVATALGIPAEHVNAAIADGILPVHKIGTKSKILVTDIEVWVRSWPVRTYKKKVPAHG